MLSGGDIDRTFCERRQLSVSQCAVVDSLEAATSVALAPEIAPCRLQLLKESPKMGLGKPV